MKPKPTKQRARDIFLKWCDPKRKDRFEIWYSDKVFTAIRVPKSIPPINVDSKDSMTMSVNFNNKKKK